jgi:hypothetical protein
MKSPKYERGAEARNIFENTMSKLFRVPKSEVVKLKPPPKKASEKSEC